MEANDKPRRRRLFVLVFFLTVLCLLAILSLPRRRPFDYIAWKAAELKHDPDAVFTFVRDRVRTDPYNGCLRGAVGTLWGGAGNDMDQAVLLAALLRECGETVRFARGKSVWVQRRQGGKWSDLNPVPGLETGPAEWTGEELPDDVYHKLTATVKVTGANGGKEYGLEWRTADLVGRPLILSYEGKTCTLRREGEERRVEGAFGLSEDEAQEIVFSYRAPGAEKPIVFSREIYTRRYPGYRVLDDPRNRHVIHVSVSTLPQWVFDREVALSRSEEGRFADEDVCAGYLLTLSHMLESDKGLRQMEKHFGTRAYFTEPRVIIASTYHGNSDEEPTYRALDLRRNVVHIDGDENTRAALAVTRSIYEGVLEGTVLKKVTGDAVITAFDIMRDFLDHVQPSTPERLRLYASSLERLVKETRPGARLTFSVDDKRKVTFARGAGDTVLVDSISDPLKAKMKASDAKFEVLTGKEVKPKQFGRAALELETLFGPVGGAATDYRPTVDLEESTEELLFANSRIFRVRHFKGWPFPLVHFEYQFLQTEGDLKYEAVDYWDERNKKSYVNRGAYHNPGKFVESGDIFSWTYGQNRFDKGSLNVCFSRKMHRELKEKGETVIRYMKSDQSLSDPIKLFVCKTADIPIFVNNRPRQVPALWVAGGYVKENPQKEDYEKVKDIRDPGNNAIMNKFIVLDNARFPLVDIRNARFQTAIPGRVTSAKTGFGIPDVQVTVEGTEAKGTTWGDGRLVLPIIKKPFATFTVTATKRGYASYRREINFLAPNALPLNIQLAPRPEKEDYVWVNAKNADTQLAKLDGLDRSKDLIRRALMEAPDLVALAPTKRIAHGGSAVHAWLLFDNANFHITGVTEDGLHAAAGLGGFIKDWAKNGAKAGLGVGGSPYEMQTGAINYYSGFIASWYAYSAGKLDAISRMMDGEEFDDLGHSHAIKFAKAWLEGMSAVLDTPFGVGRAAGIRSEQFKAGFAKGLEFFEKNPEFRGG
ncbi:MAG: hypothetical protein GXP25_02360 [Planctomycetes bacterium]|nr:hypothetical protein [Planctomycetota bacterium]